MPTKKTSTPAVEALRARRERLGLHRREVYLHDDDWPAIRAKVDKLNADRERKATRKRKAAHDPT